MAGDADPGRAKAAGIVGILIGLVGLVEFICGCIYAGLGAKDGSGLWSGLGVSTPIGFSQAFYLVIL